MVEVGISIAKEDVAYDVDGEDGEYAKTMFADFSQFSYFSIYLMSGRIRCSKNALVKSCATASVLLWLR